MVIFNGLLSERLSFADERENLSVASGLNYNPLFFNKPCDEASGAAQGSQGQTDLELERVLAS